MDDRLSYRNDDTAGFAYFDAARTEDGEPYMLLHGYCAVPNRLAKLTIAFSSEGERNWAIETWRSARFAGEMAVRHVSMPETSAGE